MSAGLYGTNVVAASKPFGGGLKTALVVELAIVFRGPTRGAASEPCTLLFARADESRLFKSINQRLRRSCVRRPKNILMNVKGVV